VRRRTRKSDPHDNQPPREEQPKRLNGSPQMRPTMGMRCDPRTSAEMVHPHQGPAAEQEQGQPQGETGIPHGAPQDPCGWIERRPRTDCVEESRR